MFLKNFRKAIRVFSAGNLLYILFFPYIEQVCEKCGCWSIPHILVSAAIWFLCVIATMVVLLSEENGRKMINKISPDELVAGATVVGTSSCLYFKA